MNVALIVFAGTGSRISSNIPKQFIKIKDKELVAYTIEVFSNCGEIDEIVLVTHKDYLDYVKEMVSKYNFFKVKTILAGGESRQDSVRIGLENTKYKDDDNILIHDGDRPLVSEDIILENIHELENHEVVATAINHRDSLLIVSNAGRRVILEGEEIDIQTPQSFKYGLSKSIHLAKRDEKVSDDISLVESEYPVYFVSGSKYNFKVTTDEDLKVVKSFL